MRSHRCVRAALVSIVALLSFSTVASGEVYQQPWDSPAFMATFSSVSSEPDSHDLPIIEKWKTNVRGTVAGEQLITVLDSVDSTLKTNGVDVQALYKRGYLYGTIGANRSAIVDLSKAIMADPEIAAFHCERGICYMDAEDYGRALQDLNAAVKLNPRSGDAHLARGRLFLLLNNHQMALSDLLLCENGNLDYTPILPGEMPGNYFKAPEYFLGICYDAMGRPDDAIKHFNNALTAGPMPANSYIHRYADQPLDTAERIRKLEQR